MLSREWCERLDMKLTIDVTQKAATLVSRFAASLKSLRPNTARGAGSAIRLSSNSFGRMDGSQP